MAHQAFRRSTTPLYRCDRDRGTSKGLRSCSFARIQLLRTDFFNASMMFTTLLLSSPSSFVDFQVLVFDGFSAFFLSAMILSKLSWIGSDTVSGDQPFSRFLIVASSAEAALASDVRSKPVKYSLSGRVCASRLPVHPPVGRLRSRSE